MKILMFTHVDKSKNTMSGVLKKMYGQIQALEKQGFDCFFVYRQDQYLMLEEIKTKQIIKRVPQSTQDIYYLVNNFTRDIQPEYIYIRSGLADHAFVNFLRKIRLQYQSKIILEFPTLPYDLEVKGQISSNIDKYWRNKMGKYVDLAVNYNNYKEVFGIPAISISNGICIENIPRSNGKLNNNELNMIAVAALAIWHGYDRLIQGMEQYYRNSPEKNVHLHIVGNEQQDGILSSLEGLIKKHGLTNKVILHGFKSGNDLNEVFDQCHIGVGSLALHRINLKEGSALKEQEYCARGMPFINAFKNTIFPEEFKYKLTFSSDETPISIDRINSFYLSIVQDRDYKEHIRQYAESHLIWEKSLEPVIRWMKERVHQ